MLRHITELKIDRVCSKGWASNKQLPRYDKKYWKIFNASYASIQFTQHHISQKQLPMLTVINKVMTKDPIQLNQFSLPKLTWQKL